MGLAALTVAYALISTPARAAGAAGLIVDLGGVVILAHGLIAFPELRTTYGGEIPGLEEWFKGGRKEAIVGLAFVFLGFACQIAAQFLPTC